MNDSPSARSPAKAVSHDLRNRVLVAYFEAVNGDRLDEAVALFAPEATVSAPGVGVCTGRTAIGQFLRSALAPYAEHRDTTEAIHHAETVSTVEIRFAGALTGGTPIAFDALDLFEFSQSGAIVRMTNWLDSRDVARQLREARAPGAEPPRVSS